MKWKTVRRRPVNSLFPLLGVLMQHQAADHLQMEELQGAVLQHPPLRHLRRSLPPCPDYSRAIREVIRRAATSTSKRKQPETGEEGGLSWAGSREHLEGTAQRNGQAAATDLPLNEDSQRQQKNTTDTYKAKKRCECGSRQPNIFCTSRGAWLEGSPVVLALPRLQAQQCRGCHAQQEMRVEVRRVRAAAIWGYWQQGWPLMLTVPLKSDNALDVMDKLLEFGLRCPAL